MSSLAKSLELRQDSILVDFMSGHADAANSVVNYYATKNINVTPILVDKFSSQFPKNNSYVTLLSDVLSIPIPYNSVHAVTMKLGIHEISSDKQIQVFNKAYNILKPACAFSICEIAERDDSFRDLFSLIVKKKDELAGFDDFVKNRFFCTQKELESYFLDSGFNPAKQVMMSNFNYNYSYLLQTDFKNDKSKLLEFLDFIRNVVPKSYKKDLGFIDFHDSINLEFRMAVLSAVKS